MTVHFLVEGTSEQALFERWAPRAIKGTPIRVHPHQGKGTIPALDAIPVPDRRGVLDQLPAKLRAFSNSLNVELDAVVILVDLDDDDADELREQLRAAIAGCAPDLRVFAGIAVEETEAFYLADLKGLKKAFPHADMAKAMAFEPDSVCGTWELLAEIVGDNGDRKVDWAERMGPVLTTKAAESRSPSFKLLLAGLRQATAPLPPSKKKRKKFAHRAKSARR